MTEWLGDASGGRLAENEGREGGRNIPMAASPPLATRALYFTSPVRGAGFPRWARTGRHRPPRASFPVLRSFVLPGARPGAPATTRAHSNSSPPARACCGWQARANRAPPLGLALAGAGAARVRRGIAALSLVHWPAHGPRPPLLCGARASGVRSTTRRAHAGRARRDPA